MVNVDKKDKRTDLRGLPSSLDAPQLEASPIGLWAARARRSWLDRIEWSAHVNGLIESNGPRMSQLASLQASQLA